MKSILKNVYVLMSFVTLIILPFFGAKALAETIPPFSGRIVISSGFNSPITSPNFSSYKVGLRVFGSCSDFTLAKRETSFGKDGSYGMPPTDYSSDEDKKQTQFCGDPRVIVQVYVIDSNGTAVYPLYSESFPYLSSPDPSSFQAALKNVHYTEIMEPLKLKISWGAMTLEDYVQKAIVQNPKLAGELSQHPKARWTVQGRFALKSIFMTAPSPEPIITDFGNCHVIITKENTFPPGSSWNNREFGEAPGSHCGEWANSDRDGQAKDISINIGSGPQFGFVPESSHSVGRLLQQIWWDDHIENDSRSWTMNVRIDFEDPSQKDPFSRFIGTLFVGQLTTDPLPAGSTEINVPFVSPSEAKFSKSVNP